MQKKVLELYRNAREARQGFEAALEKVKPPEMGHARVRVLLHKGALEYPPNGEEGDEGLMVYYRGYLTRESAEELGWIEFQGLHAHGSRIPVEVLEYLNTRVRAGK